MTRTTRRRWLQSQAVTAALTAMPVLGDEPREDVSVHRQIQAAAADAPLSMRFRGSTADECRAWQRDFRAKLGELLGEFQPPAKWTTHVEREVELEDHRRRELLLSAKGHPTLPVHLLLPKGFSEDTPGKSLAGIVAVHGHGAYGYDPVAGKEESPGVAKAIASANYDYGRQLVRQGYVVACPCLAPFGRRLGGKPREGGTDPCAVTFVRMQLLGKVLMGENLRDVLWSRALVAALPQVDAARIGCVGLSYGGRMTMLAAAMEPRFAAAVISGALNVMQERIQVAYSCGAQVIPGLLKFGDVPDIGALIAPRPAVWEWGSRDGLIKPDWAEGAIKVMRRAYGALGAEHHLHVARFEGGHRYHGERAAKVLSEGTRM